MQKVTEKTQLTVDTVSGSLDIPQWEIQIQTLFKEIFKWHCPFNLLGHSAVDAKVDRIGDADTDVFDEKNYQVTLSP